MEDIDNLKIYIKNNYPNIIINGDDNFLLLTNNIVNHKTYKKIKYKLNAKEVNNYLMEFNFDSRKIFEDMTKFNNFPEYKNLWDKFLKDYPSDKNLSEIVCNKWIWEHDNKKEILIDIESYDHSIGVIFKDMEIMYINKDDDLLIQNTIDEDLIKRTKSFRHIKFYECDGYHDDNYYNKEKYTHQHCLRIIDNRDDNTEYYKEESDPKNIKFNVPIPVYNQDESFENSLQVIPYDIINNILKEINHGFLVKEIDDVIYSYKRLVNNKEIELSDNDKLICAALGITYQKF